MWYKIYNFPSKSLFKMKTLKCFVCGNVLLEGARRVSEALLKSSHSVWLIYLSQDIYLFCRLVPEDTISCNYIHLCSLLWWQQNTIPIKFYFTTAVHITDVCSYCIAWAIITYHMTHLNNRIGYLTLCTLHYYYYYYGPLTKSVL